MSNQVFTKLSQSGKTIAIDFSGKRMVIAVDGKPQATKNQQIEKAPVKGMGQQWIAGGLVVLTESEAQEVIAIRKAAQDLRELERLQAVVNGKDEIIATGAVKLYQHDGEYAKSWHFRFGDLQEQIDLPTDFAMPRVHDHMTTWGLEWQLDMVEYQQVLTQVLEPKQEVKQKPKLAAPIKKEYWETDCSYGFAE